MVQPNKILRKFYLTSYYKFKENLKNITFLVRRKHFRMEMYTLAMPRFLL